MTDLQIAIAVRDLANRIVESDLAKIRRAAEDVCEARYGKGKSWEELKHAIGELAAAIGWSEDFLEVDAS